MEDDLRDLFGDSSSDDDDNTTTDNINIPNVDPPPIDNSEMDISEVDSAAIDNSAMDASAMDITPSIDKSSVKSMQIPQIDPLDPSDKLFLVKLPNFLHIQPTAFDQDSWTPDALLDGQHAENTIRWKYDRVNNRKKSNARLVR